MKAILTFDGVDFTRFLTEGGIRWSRNDLDADGSGRSLDGVMRRRRVAVKRKLTFTFQRMDTRDMLALNEAILPAMINVSYLDAIEGMTTRTFYGSTVEATTQVVIKGETYWEGTTFSLIER